jgi:short-subunit dehydrogenase
LHDSARRLFGADSEASRERFEKALAATSPEQAARCILAGVAKNRRRILIGRDARFLSALQSLFGASYQVIVGRIVHWSARKQSAPESAARA